MLKGKKFDAFTLWFSLKVPFKGFECPFKGFERTFRDFEQTFQST